MTRRHNSFCNYVGRLRSRLAAWAALVVVPLSACHAGHHVEPRRVLRLIVSSAGGVDYTDLAREYGHAVPSVELRPYDAISSLDALEALQRGHADVGFIMADLSYLAYAGRLDGQTARFDRLRAVFASGVLPLQLVARRDSGIRSVSDLSGHSVAVGVRGSAIERVASVTLKAFGIPLTAITPKALPSMRAADALRAGTVQAMFVIGAFPGPAPAEPVRVALNADAYLVPIDGPGADRLREMNRYMRLAVIPPATYRQQRDSISTIGVENLLICRSDLDEQLVYELTKGFFQAVPKSSPLVDAFRSMDVDQAATTSIPLHEGAARYYRERDLFQ
jgi:uncharacterized protein